MMEFVKIEFNVKSWKDKATSLWIVSSSRFAISAYGRTKQQAFVMFKIQVQQILLSTKPKAPKRKIK